MDGPPVDAYVPTKRERFGGEAEMVNEPRNENRWASLVPTDVGLVTLSGVALVNAEPEPALDVARRISHEFPGGCPCLFVVDCDRMTHGQMAFAMGWYLADSSRGRVSGSLVVFREVQFLSPSNQTLLAQLLAGRRRGDDAVRIVATSSTDLYKRLCDQEFDSSLFYLLNVVTLTQRRTVRMHAPRHSATRPDTEGDSTG